jgi:RNA polymerase sigma-70 factor (ECF subfamily)
VSEPDRDRDCLRRLMAGDEAALDELYDRHSDLLYSVAVRIVGETSEAEEVLQDTWVQAWRKAPTFDAARGTVGAWLVTIARSRALDRVRSRGSRSRAERAAGAESVATSPPAADASVAVVWSDLGSRVASALGVLDPQHRNVVELAYYGGLSQSEIATRLGAPLGTVKSWTRQALTRLRELVPEGEST